MPDTASCKNRLGPCAMRFERLDAATGIPVSGSATGAWAVCAGVVQLGLTPNLYTGDDIAEADGCGNLVVVRKYPDQVKRGDVTLDFLTYDWPALELLYGASLLTNAGDIIGVADLIDVSCGEALVPPAVALHVWSQNWACDVPGDPTYIHDVFPFLNMKPDARTLAKGVVHVKAKGYAFANPNYASGAFGDTPILPATAWHAEFEDDALPDCTGSCGYLATPAMT